MGIHHGIITRKARSLRSCREWASAVSQTTGRAGMSTATKSTTAPPLVVAFLMLLITTATTMIPCANGATTSEDVCERLSERSLQYTQEKAPRDLSGLVGCIVRYLFVCPIVVGPIVVDRHSAHCNCFCRISGSSQWS